MSFANWRGLTHLFAACTRTDVPEWVQSLRAENLSTPTLADKATPEGVLAIKPEAPRSARPST